MQIRFNQILPLLGLLLFAAVTYRSMGVNTQGPDGPHKYYWWSSLRLDTDPLNRHPAPAQPCSNGAPNCSTWMLQTQWITPAYMDRLLIYASLPAFLAGTAIVAELSKRGVDEVLTFMVSMPILLFLWFYFSGWLLDRLIARLQSRRARTENTSLKLT